MKKIILFSKRYIKKYRIYFVGLLFSILITKTITAYFPVFGGAILDQIVYKQSLREITEYFMVFFSFFLINQVFHFFIIILWAKLMTQFIFDIKTDLFKKIISLNGEKLSNIRSGDLVKRLCSDTEHFMFFIYNNLMYIMGNIVILIVSIYLLWKINWRVCIMLFLTTPLIAFVSDVYAKRIRKRSHQYFRKAGEYNSWLFDVLSCLQDLKFAGALNQVCKRLFINIKSIMRDGIEIERMRYCSTITVSGITMIINMLVFGFCILMAGRYQMTVGEVSVVISYLGSCVYAFRSINKKMAKTGYNIAAMNRVIEIMECPGEDYQCGCREGIIHGEIDLKKIDFFYPGNEKKIYDAFSLKIHAGHHVAVFGQSGIGKTTLVNLLCRFWEINKGSIMIDGRSVSDYNIEYLRDRIGIVAQDAELLYGTVRFNISFSDEVQNDQKIWDLLDKTHLSDVICALPDKLDTVVGKGGLELSGGQKQKLVIARALFRDPQIIVMDEATRALDFENEKYIIDLCNSLDEKTVIFISHRQMKKIDMKYKIEIGEKGYIYDKKDI